MIQPNFARRPHLVFRVSRFLARLCTLAAFGVAIATASIAAAAANSPQRITMLVDIGGHEIEGMPLAWSRDRVYLLARDGKLWDFVPNNSAHFRKISSYFNSYSAAEIRAGLEREFAGKLEVTGTGHYLVAHPPGKTEWPARFEELYRSCIHYFTSRGLKVREPEFPLVAVVWANHQDFCATPLAKALVWQRHPRLLFADHQSRHALRPRRGPVEQSRLAAKRFDDHPRGHASNGLQHRRAKPLRPHAHLAGRRARHAVRSPRRLGLAQLSEPRRPHQPRAFERISPMASQRAPARRVRESADLRPLVPDEPVGGLCRGLGLGVLPHRNLSAEVRPVRRSPRPSRQISRTYPSAQRLSDFTAVFGDDLRMLEKHFLAFMDTLK